MTVYVSDLDLSTPAPVVAPAITAVGQVYAVDPDTATVTVDVHDGVVALPGMPGRYRVTGDRGLARIVLHPVTGRAVYVAGPVDPVPPVILAPVTAVASGLVTVTWGGMPMQLPAAGGTFTVGQSAWVYSDDWGRPVLASAPSTIAPPPVEPPRVVPPVETVVTVTKTIGPTWSGTWRSSRGAWDQWNAGRSEYGGRSTLYQGDAFGSDPLKGLACYGTQVTNLGALSITSAVVTLRGADLRLASYPAVTVQGSAHGSRPAGGPSSSGSTASGSPGRSGVARVALPADLREGLRTGALRGLALVGGGYNAVRGTSAGDGMTLTLTYTRKI